jgi:hypothetical protein
MKLNKTAKILLVISLIVSVYSTSTNTHTNTHSRTKSKTSSKTSFKTTSKTSTETSIFGSFKLEKIKSHQDTKVSSDSAIRKGTNVFSVSGASDDSLTDLNIGPGPIYLTGWLKYLRYNKADEIKGEKKSFFLNNNFYQQYKSAPNADYKNEKEKDGIGKLVNKYIKSPQHFYAILMRNNLNILSGKSANLISQNVDLLDISNIDDVLEQPGYGEGSDNINGIQDFGNFSEGYCFKILTNANTDIWVFCADDEETKSRFMLWFKKLKIQTQRDNGQIKIPQAMKPKNQKTIESMLQPDNTNGMTVGKDGLQIDPTKNNMTDGYWITLQDWSQCSLKCGGGTSTMQRMCIPPKNGGSPCEGKAVLSKACNQQPCPAVLSTTEKTSSSSKKTMKPVVRVLPFSTRPQRYSKCVIKESDLMYTQNFNGRESNNPNLKGDSTTSASMQIPTRVIMNNATISVYAGESYDSQIVIFNIQQTAFSQSKNHATCFILRDPKKSAELCPFGFDSSSKMLDEWESQFQLFKDRCSQPRETNGKNLTTDQEMAKKLEDKIKTAKKGLLEEQEKEIKAQAVDDEETTLEKKEEKTNQITLQAIQKELNIEALVKKEEADREKLEETLMIQTIEEEKKKSDCLISAIQQKEIEDETNKKTQEAEKVIEQAKKAAAAQVIERRESLKKQITQMRAEAEKRKKKLSAQLQTVKTQMAQTMGKVYKKGNAESCVTALSTEQERANYCVANFPDDMDAFSNCKQAENFCSLCCEFEFGEMNGVERTACKQKACPAVVAKETGQPVQGPTDPTGQWVWQAGMQSS